MISKAAIGTTEGLERRYKPLNEARRNALRTVKKAGAKLDPEEDSDDDMYTTEQRLKQKDAIDILLYVSLCKQTPKIRPDKNQWVPATVVSITDEVALVEYQNGEEKQHEWLEIESDRLMPANSMTKNVQWHLAAEIDANLYVSGLGI